MEYYLHEVANEELHTIILIVSNAIYTLEIKWQTIQQNAYSLLKNFIWFRPHLHIIIYVICLCN